jgi:glycosyltransferase involved in cell wall biosynthesis
VLLPVRDAAPWLASSLASLWRQTFADFEVVAVDDGSTDSSGEMLERAARREPRLRVVHTPARGLPAALATALERARAPLIARHDADDLSHRRRFALQRAHLRAHPHDALVGCRLRVFPATHAGAGMRRWAAWHNALLDHDAMADEALIDSPLAHGTAMVRRAWLERVGGWRERGWAEDLDLWLRLLERGARFAKLPRVLYGWRQHPGSSTRRDPRYRPERFLDLREHFLARGFLRHHGRLTLVGVGTTGDAWERRLARRARVDRVMAGRPSAATVAALRPPVVLVFGARPARERWRVALRAAGSVERRDFVFVA